MVINPVVIIIAIVSICIIFAWMHLILWRKMQERILQMSSPEEGTWLKIYDNTYMCSVCQKPQELSDGTPHEHNLNYCPNCGAKMIVAANHQYPDLTKIYAER